MHKLVLSLVVCALAGLGAAPASAAGGKALGVDPAAEAHRASERHTLTVGADIFIGDRVLTGPRGQVQIMFDDSTELVVGPSSALLIEDYLLRNNGSAGKLAINALSGTFRFVTGSAPKDRYTIRTPTGTIGVRGTAFELYVTPQWSYVMMQHGSTISCNSANECVTLEAQCEVGQFSNGQALVVGEANRLSTADRATLRQFFRYAASQRPLLEEFRIPLAERCLRRAINEDGPPPSLSEQGEGDPNWDPNSCEDNPNSTNC